MKFDTQLQPATETSWVVSYGGKTIPRWRTAAILKIDISPYLSEKSSDFHETLYTSADFELDECHVIKNEKVALDRLSWVRQNVFLVYLFIYLLTYLFIYFLHLLIYLIRSMQNNIQSIFLTCEQSVKAASFFGPPCVRVSTINPMPTVAAKEPGWNLAWSNWTSSDVFPTPLSPTSIVYSQRDIVQRPV